MRTPSLSAVLGHDVHGHLAQVEVGAYARRGGDARLAQHLVYQLHRQLARRHAVRLEVVGGVDEHLVHRVYVYVLRRYVAQVNAVDARRILHVEPHARRRHYVVKFPPVVGLHVGVVCGAPCEDALRREAQALHVHLPHLLHHLEQACAPRDAVGLQRRCHRQAYRLLGP